MEQNAPARARRGYASGLDGIRALAVIAVILFHAGVPGLRGGFVGVDLFFVVSGYLVTALLQREHDRTGRIRFGSFFRRRARRLLPALVLMLTVVSAATLALGHDLERRPAQPVPRSVHVLQQLDPDRQGHFIRHQFRARGADPSLVARGRGTVLPALAGRLHRAAPAAETASAAGGPRGRVGTGLGGGDGGDISRRDGSDPVVRGHRHARIRAAPRCGPRLRPPVVGHRSGQGPATGPADRAVGCGGADFVVGGRRRCGVVDGHRDSDVSGRPVRGQRRGGGVGGGDGSRRRGCTHPAEPAPVAWGRAVVRMRSICGTGRLW